ncbi:IucA/IucC family siderophore biosynthesis protein [Halobacillus salinarum]|uniref:IucA/IucC family siderophore biosynthesis protein n=1 Tax=Halobacillus salinarum TaxID=2932257 RepID=A0ABY4EHI8_9BACI|nr:IucA/IucC family siderophore biosynthesis protein [Halobacillus salinarum]UOQ43929.1 IucA/IucC family siderophore biosynthesis protein [Halobacillus salinarum]
MFLKNELEKVLTEESWQTANKNLLAKMLAEYMYEDMITPEVLAEKENKIHYELAVSDKKAYRYTAYTRFFDSFDVIESSIEVIEDGTQKKADNAIDFLLDLKPVIGMSSETAAHLIKELNATLIADAHLLQKDDKSADELLHTDYADLEGYMTGHPWITYNKGRIGFGYDDYLDYAPENHKQVRLSWVAVHKSITSFQTVTHFSAQQLIQEELSEEEKHSFENELLSRGKQLEDYYYLPVHEWQWKNMIIPHFPLELANESIVPLGEGEDWYLPQQSIRTFVNVSNKEKHHVKVPMSILNTLVYRGLPAERTLVAPKVTELIKGIYHNDSFLKEECRVILPGEIASLNVDQKHFAQLEGAPYQYLEMLGAIWRESIYTYLEEGEQAITLAALLHIDHQGKPFIKSLIEASGLEAEEWMKQFFKVTMDPLLHFLYQYGTVFSPHGQNTILVIKDGKPHRLAVKDFVDDVNITDQPFPELDQVTDELKSVLRSEPPEGLTQFIFTGLFICHLRYLSHIVVNHELMSEEIFWGLLAESIHQYQHSFPHLQERFELFDFFKPEMTKLCLNRNRMVDYGYSDDDDRPHASEYGKVKNILSFFQVEERV